MPEKATNNVSVFDAIKPNADDEVARTMRSSAENIKKRIMLNELQAKKNKIMFNKSQELTATYQTQEQKDR